MIKKEVQNIFQYTLLAHVMGMPPPVVGSILTTHSFFVVCILLVFSHQNFVHFFLELHQYLDIIAPAFLFIWNKYTLNQLYNIHEVNLNY